MTDTTPPLWLDVRYIDDHLLMTTTDVWTYVIVPGLRTNMPTQDEVNRIVRGVERVIEGVGDDTFELHYHLAYRDMNTKAWADALDATATNATPAWSDYLERMRRRLRQFGFQDRVIYLGVRIGTRSALEKPQLRGASPGETIKAWVGSLVKAAAGVDPQPSPKEVERWRAVAQKTRQALGASLLDAVPAAANDMAWLIRHIQRLGMPDTLTPDKVTEWGAGTIYSLAEGVVDNSDPTHLTLALTGRNKNIAAHMARYQEETAKAQRMGVPGPEAPPTHYTSHVAVLGLGDLPEETVVPWLLHAAALPFPVEVSARVTVLSHEQAEKETAKALLNQKNALEDAAAAGLAGHSRDRKRARAAAQLHQEITEGGGRRQIAATYRLVVAAPSRELVGSYAEEAIRHYRENGGTDITVQWAPGDQLALWEELIPGQKRRTGLWTQRQDLITFCVGLPFSVSRAGDGEGPYIGLIEHGTPSPVFFDLATAAKRGRATTTALTGSLGGGKRLALDTPIPTPTGWTTMGDLVEGDTIFDERGVPCTVVHVAPVEVDTDAYEVVFDDGTVIVADADHLWETHTLAYRRSLAHHDECSTHIDGVVPTVGSSTQVAAVDAAIRTEGPILTTVAQVHDELDGRVPGSLITNVASRLDAVTNTSGAQVYRAQDLERAGLAVPEGALYVTCDDLRAQGLTRQTLDDVLAGVPAITEESGTLYNRLTLLHALAEHLRSPINGEQLAVLAPTVVTTEEIRRTLRVGGHANHAIPVAGPLDLPEASLPIAPYTLGAWLGAGHLGSASITTSDDEIALNIEAEGYDCLRAAGHETLWRIGTGHQTMDDLLRDLGLTHDKHIPMVYLRASVEQRQALLAGLLDTDGTCTPDGTVELVCTSERLARDAFELVLSLGHKATVTSIPCERDGRADSTAWKVAFLPVQKVFRLSRKLAQQVIDERGGGGYRHIVDVRAVSSVPMRCIQVDSPTHLYLAGRTFVPTHNTFLMLTLMDHMRLRGYPIIALDPKGDVKGHLLLKGRGDARFFDLSTDGKPGSLDPFRLVPYVVDPDDPERDTPQKALARWREETRTLVTDVVDQLLDGVRYDRMSTAVALALNAEMERERPSMAHLLEVLSMGGVKPPQEAGVSPETLSEYRMAAIGAHAHLKNAAETQLGRLMFAPASGENESLFSGGVTTTIVSLAGLDLPRDGNPPQTLSQRFSVALFSLVAHQSRRMLQELDYVGPRALIIDEAHQITGLQSGRSLIVSNARMGRSRDIALVLATQSTADLLGDDLRNVISTVFAFRTSGVQERREVAVMLGREPDDAMVEALLPNQDSEPGRCLFLDLDMNLVSLRVDRWAHEYDKAFDTNPTRKEVSAAGVRVETDAHGVVRDPMGGQGVVVRGRSGAQVPVGMSVGAGAGVASVPSPTVQVDPPRPVQPAAQVAPSVPGVGQVLSVPSPEGVSHHTAAPQVRNTPAAVPAAVTGPGVGAVELVEDEGWWSS